MIMSACAASVGARCPPGGVWRDSALSRRVSNDRPARCALLPASGLEIVRQRRPRTSWAPSRPPNVLAVSRRIGREALAQDALKLRFVGSAVLQVMVVAAAGASRVAGRVTPSAQIAFCTGSVRRVSHNGGRLHASPDRDDLGRHDDRSADLPRGLGVPAASGVLPAWPMFCNTGGAA